MKCKVHKYTRSKLGNKIIYKCVKCPSYVFGELILGRQSICYGCEKTFTIGLKNLQKNPHCGCLTKVYKDKYKLNKPDTNPDIINREELLDLLMRKI